MEELALAMVQVQYTLTQRLEHRLKMLHMLLRATTQDDNIINVASNKWGTGQHLIHHPLKLRWCIHEAKIGGTLNSRIDLPHLDQLP